MNDRPGVRFAIAIPQHVAGGTFDPAAFRAFMTRAEELGFESAWTQEQVLGDMPNLGPLETMAYAAACSERIRLGCAVLVSTLHSPLHLAKSIATLDQLSRGRIEVGLGSGGRYRAFAAFDVDPATFVGRFTEGLALMRACWTEPRIDFDGRFWQVAQGAMEPKPVQSPHPPLWLAGGHPDALRRAVRLGDGFFGAGSSTTAQFVEHAAVIRAALEEAGRDPAGFPIAKRVYLAVRRTATRHAARSPTRSTGCTGSSACVTSPPSRWRARRRTASRACRRWPTPAPTSSSSTRWPASATRWRC